MSRNLVARLVIAAEFRAHALQQRVHSHQKLFRRQPAPLRIPHPFVAHRANAALYILHGCHAAQRSRHHVAMFESRDKLVALLRIVPQPVQQLRESPLVRINTTTPIDPLESQLMRLLRNLLRFGKCAMIAPQVIFVQRLEVLAHWNHARSGRVERNCRNIGAIHTRALQHFARCRRQRRHLVSVSLRCIIRVFPLAVQRIRSRCRPNRAFLAVNKGYANTQCAKVDTSHNRHLNLTSGKRFLPRKPDYNIPLPHVSGPRPCRRPLTRPPRRTDLLYLF